MSRIERAASPVYLDGYVRVSRVGKRRGPSFISPEVQREAIEDWAGRQGFRLLEVFEELDESGARADRPLLEQAIRRIEIGASTALVVWRVDRFGRSLSDGARMIERIRSAGGGFYSVHDGLDIGTDAGRLVLRILLSVAEYQLDGLRMSWEASRARAVERGVYAGTGIPVGYRRPKSGRLRPDPKTAPVMAEVYRRRAGGETLGQLCRLLESEHVLTGKGNPGWGTATLSHVLGMRVYLGEVYWASYRREGAHPPLIDPATWEAAQRPRLLNVKRVKYEPALLTGVARCAACRHVLKAHKAHPTGRREYNVYGCLKRHAGGVCPAPAYMNASKLEPFVLEAALRLLARRRRRPSAELKACEAKAALAARALVRYRDSDQIAVRLGEEAFLDGLTVRAERLRDANLAVAEARTRVAVFDLPPVAEIREAIPTMPVEKQRDLILRVIDAVFVTAGRGPASARVTICPAGTAPRSLPRPGDRGLPPVRIQPRRDWINPQPS
jgi:DNA invertase Pin-like site-specific DNA recombinase